MRFSYLIDELDKTLALVGVFFSLILTIWLALVIERPIFTLVGILCFIFVTGYLVIRRFAHPSLILFLEEMRCSTRVYIILNIFFFILLSYSIISIYLRPEPYIRPLVYFISTSLMAVIVANEILFLSPQKAHIYFSLCKIIVIGLSLQYSQVLIFPSVVGVDPLMHQWFTLKIIDYGYIPEGLSYSNMPLTHLMIGITSLLTDLGYKMSAMFSISTLQVICDGLFVFLLGTFLISTKVGLLASLLLELSNMHIIFGSIATPNTMGATLILPIILIIFKMRDHKPFIRNLVLMFLMGPLILTHSISALVLSILLFVFWLSSLAYSTLFNQELNQSVTLTMCILYTTTMFAYWSIVSGHILFLINLIRLEFSIPLFVPSLDAFSYIPLWEQIFNYLGMFLFFSLSFIGCFYILSKQFRNNNRVIIMISGIIVLCIGFFSLITDLTLISERWFYFSQILLAIPLSLSLFLINGIFKHRLIKGFLMSFSVFILAFLLIMSSWSNIDNRIFSPNSGIRLAFTDSELQAGNTISNSWNGTVGTDWLYSYFFKHQFDNDVISIDNSLETRDFINLQGILILIREEMMNYPLHGFFSNNIYIKYNPFIALEDQKFSRIYNCGSVSGYLKR